MQDTELKHLEQFKNIIFLLLQYMAILNSRSLLFTNYVSVSVMTIMLIEGKVFGIGSQVPLLGKICLYVCVNAFRLYIPVNNFSVMSGRFPGLYQY